MTKEMEIWLGSNMETFEQIMLHAFLHHPEHRTMLLGAGLDHSVFVDVKTGLLFAGMCLGARVLAQNNAPFPEPPNYLWLLSNVAAINKEESIATPDELAQALVIGESLLDRKRHENDWHSVSSYFAGWLGTSTMRKMARKVQGSRVLDPGQVASMFQAASTRASSIYVNSVDDLEQAMSGEDEELIERIETGFHAFDEAIGGGLAGGETGLIVGGTGAGKSVLVSQISDHMISTKQPVSVISTEMPAVKYLARMVAKRCRIRIQKFVNCQNWRQIEQIVASTESRKLDLLDALKEEIDTLFGFKKLDPDSQSSVRSVLDTEVLRFEKARGCRPKVIFFDWMGRMVNDSKASSSSDRSAVWERVADEFVKFGEVSGVSVVVLAQAVNDSSKYHMLGLEHIGVGKGIAKPMSWTVMITNYVDKEAFRDSLNGRGDAPASTVSEDQHLCLAKSRNGASIPPIPVSRKSMQFQTFDVATPK